MKIKLNLILLFIAIVLFSLACQQEVQEVSAEKDKKEVEKKEEKVKNLSKKELPKTEEDWKKILTKKEYEILRKKGTEPRGTGDLLHVKEKGSFHCAGCGQLLFESKTKYKSGSGWPSFWDVVDKDRVKLVKDTSYGMTRTEVVCSRCGGHLGHLFEDGPKPTGKRYCINSISLDFKKAEAKKEKKASGEKEKGTDKDPKVKEKAFDPSQGSCETPADKKEKEKKKETDQKAHE